MMAIFAPATMTFTADVQETVANTSGFANMHGDGSMSRGRSSMVERQPSKLAVEGSSPFARYP